jgi:hypothetical protein
MFRGKAIVSAALLLVPALALSEPASLTQLRAAAEGAESSVYSSSLEGASAGNQAWADDSRSYPAARSAVPGPFSNAAPAPPPSPRPNLVANIPSVPDAAPGASKPLEPDPVPPKIKGWVGFKMGFLGMEALGMRVTSKAGRLALPLLILLQPVIAPIALVAGILGAFGIRL